MATDSTDGDLDLLLDCESVHSDDDEGAVNAEKVQFSSFKQTIGPHTQNQWHYYVPPTEGVGHIVFGADPVGVRVASFRRDIF